ncbi:MAG: lipo-like protein, partial [Mesorhizobium sp.]
SYMRREILHIRHHSLYTPRDFDLSPFFRIVKPTLEYGFDYRAVAWGDAITDAEAAEAGAIASER